MTTDEIRTLRDLNYLARKQLALSQYDVDRLYSMNQEILVGSPTDPDVGYLLGLMASTDDGRYWRSLIDQYAAEIGVTVKTGGTHTPTPAPVPEPDPAPVPAPVPVSGDFTAQLVAALAAYDIHVRPGKLGVGVIPDPDDNAALHIGGRANAVILGISNTNGTDGQNPGEVHKSTLVVSDNDGGMRLRQYVQWTSKGMVRNTTNRPATILAIDSMGDICLSDSRIAYGQVFYLVKRVAQGFVDLCAYQVGQRIRVLRSSSYGAADIED